MNTIVFTVYSERCVHGLRVIERVYLVRYIMYCDCNIEHTFCKRFPIANKKF